MKTYFEIQADDVERAKKFYAQVFGWTYEKMEGVSAEYWLIEPGELAGGILQRPANRPEMGHGTNAFVCSFMVDDFDQTAEIIQKLGGIVALSKLAVPGVCWQGYFLDTEGNTFGIFQPDESAE